MICKFVFQLDPDGGPHGAADWLPRQLLGPRSPAVWEQRVTAEGEIVDSLISVSGFPSAVATALATMWSFEPILISITEY